MESDVRLGANKFNERQPLGTAAQTHDYTEPPATPLIEPSELHPGHSGVPELPSFLRPCSSFQTVMGYKDGMPGPKNECPGVGIQGIAWAFGGMTFALVYCTAVISGYSCHLIGSFTMLSMLVYLDLLEVMCQRIEWPMSRAILRRLKKFFNEDRS